MYACFIIERFFFLSVSIRNRVMPSDRKWFPRFAIFYFFSFLFLGERNEAHGGWDDVHVARSLPGSIMHHDTHNLYHDAQFGPHKKSEKKRKDKKK